MAKSKGLLCGGKLHNREGTCTQPAGWGTDHLGTGKCKLHGGTTPNHKIAAQMEQARQAVSTLGLSRDIPPEQALLEEVHRAAGHVAYLGMKVAELKPDDVVWGVAEEIERPPVIGADGEVSGGGVEVKRRAELNAWVRLYQEERKRLVIAAEKAIGADAQGRVAAVFEQIGTTYVQVLERVLERLDLTEEQRARVPDAMTAELRAIAGGLGHDDAP
jgi:hypothetical protein